MALKGEIVRELPPSLPDIKYAGVSPITFPASIRRTDKPHTYRLCLHRRVLLPHPRESPQATRRPSIRGAKFLMHVARASASILAVIVRTDMEMPLTSADARPCRRCMDKGRIDECVDICHKKRGRVSKKNKPNCLNGTSPIWNSFDGNGERRLPSLDMSAPSQTILPGMRTMESLPLPPSYRRTSSDYSVPLSDPYRRTSSEYSAPPSDPTMNIGRLSTITLVCRRDFVITKFHQPLPHLLGWLPQDLEHKRSIFDLCHVVDSRTLFDVLSRPNGQVGFPSEAVHLAVKGGDYRRCVIEDVIDASGVLIIALRPIMSSTQRAPMLLDLGMTHRRSIGVQDLIDREVMV